MYQKDIPGVCGCGHARHHPDHDACTAPAVTSLAVGRIEIPMCRQCAALALAACDVHQALLTAAAAFTPLDARFYG